MVLETHMKLSKADFVEKIVSPQKLGIWTKNGPKTGFFEFMEDLVFNFYGICSMMKMYIIFCVPAQISYFEKFLFLRAKILSTNQIAGFFNQPYIQNESIK